MQFKVSFFAYNESLGKVLFLDQIEKCGISLVNPCFCAVGMRNTGVKTRVLWGLFFPFLFEVIWVFLSYDDVFVVWKSIDDLE